MRFVSVVGREFKRFLRSAKVNPPGLLVVDEENKSVMNMSEMQQAAWSLEV